MGDGIDLTENSFWTNAAYTGENAADAFSSCNVIIDGSGDTYFHSDYSGNNSTDRQNHYLGVDLGEGHDTNSFQFSYTTRSVTGNNPVCAPTKIRVQGADSKDAANSAWKTITTLDGLPEGSGTVYTSPIIESEQAYRYLRFQVMSSTGGEAGGHPIFVIAEFSINHAQLEVTPDKKYPKVTEELMMGLYNELYDAETLLAKATQSKAQLNTAYEELVAAYNALAEAMGEETIESSIEEIIMGGNGMGDGKIYDLQGRQINRVTSTGIYIVNGKKVLLRAGR